MPTTIEVRRALVKRHPYLLVYAVLADHLVVILAAVVALPVVAGVAWIPVALRAA